ncbi:hypothetical protein PJI16_11520 [Nitrospira sp. MA-1]|nr:hypothetical protein [Nitrospira sp. MA-1]
MVEIVEPISQKQGKSEKENAASDSDPIQDGEERKQLVKENLAKENLAKDSPEYKTEEKKEGEDKQPEGSEAQNRLGDILERIQGLITTYIKLPSEELAMLVAIWIAGTYCYKSFQYYGYLSIRSATPRCGKSKLLKLISLLSAENPPVTSFPTAAVLYRNPRKILIMDEVD